MRTRINVMKELEDVFHYSYPVGSLPEVFRKRFFEAVDTFRYRDIPYFKMGYAEEIGDIAYQLVKISLVEAKILVRESQKELFDEMHGFISHGRLNKDLRDVYDSAYKKTEELDLSGFDAAPPLIKEQTLRDYVANQYVSYISRHLRHPEEEDPGFQNKDYVIRHQLPAETAELIEVLTLPDIRLSGDELMEDMDEKVLDAAQLISVIKDIRRDYRPPSKGLEILDAILKRRTREDISIDDVVSLTLFKIRGRQELTFGGYDDKRTKRICKPAEYLLEARLILD